jgi:hypothetical protein
LRGIIGVMGGLVMYMVVAEVLETALVASRTEIRPTDIASYYLARNTPMVLGAKLVYNTLTAIWAGNMTARLAGERERHYGAMAAVVQTAELAWRFLAGEYATFTPAWMRAFLVLTTGPAMLIGASIRGRARSVEDPEPAPAGETPSSEDER